MIIHAALAATLALAAAQAPADHRDPAAVQAFLARIGALNENTFQPSIIVESRGLPRKGFEWAYQDVTPEGVNLAHRLVRRGNSLTGYYARVRLERFEPLASAKGPMLSRETEYEILCDFYKGPASSRARIKSATDYPDHGLGGRGVKVDFKERPWATVGASPVDAQIRTLCYVPAAAVKGAS